MLRSFEACDGRLQVKSCGQSQDQSAGCEQDLCAGSCTPACSITACRYSADVLAFVVIGEDDCAECGVRTLTLIGYGRVSSPSTPADLFIQPCWHSICQHGISGVLGMPFAS